MSSDYPSVGLRIDLGEINRGNQKLKETRDLYKEIGAAQDASSTKSKTQAAAQKGANEQVVSSTRERTKAAQQAMTAEERMAQASLRTALAAARVQTEASRTLVNMQRASTQQRLADLRAEESAQRMQIRATEAQSRAEARLAAQRRADARSGGFGDAGAVNIFTRAIHGLREALSSTRRLFFDIRTAVGIFLGGMVIGPVVQMADAMTALRARVAYFAEAATDVPYLMEAIYRTAQNSRAPLEALTTLYTRLAPMAERLGKSQMDILRTSGTIIKSFVIGGATEQESRASSQQLAQALASNRLGGDELRSLAENAPILLSQIAKSLNMNSGEFIKWAHQGKASAEVVIGAIDKAAATIDRMFKNFPLTIGQAITTVGNAFSYLVGRVNEATGASQNIAQIISGFGRFFESESTIKAVAGALNAVGKGILFVADAMKTLLSYAPAFATILGAVAVARLGAWVLGLKAVRDALLAFSASAAVAGTGTASLIAAQSMAGAMFVRLGTALRALLTPMNIIIAVLGAAAFAFNAVTNSIKIQERATETLKAAQERSADGFIRGIAYAESLGEKGTDLAKTLNILAAANMSADVTARLAAAGNDVAAQSAILRAEAEKEATARIYDRLAAEDADEAKKLRNSVNGIGGALARGWNMMVQGTVSGNGTFSDIPTDATGILGKQANAMSAASALDASAARNRAAAAAVRATPFRPTRPGSGTGIVQSTGAGSGDSLFKQFQTQRRQIDEQIAQAHAARAQIYAEMAASNAAMEQTIGLYSQGVPTSRAYAAALNEQAQAQLDVRLEQIRAETQAEKTAEVEKFGTALMQPKIDALIRARQATAVVADEQERLNRINERKASAKIEAGEMQAYAAALAGGADALRDYNRQIAINAELRARGGGSDTDAAAAVDQKRQNEAIVAEQERLNTRKESLRTAHMATRQAELETEAFRRANGFLDRGEATTRAMAENMARAQIAAERMVDEMNGLKRSVKDAVEQAFVESGKLDFRSLREGLGRAIRQAIYDKLIAKPVEIVVDAVVNVVTEGLEKVMQNILGEKGAIAKILQSFGQGYADALKTLGDKINEAVGKLPDSLGDKLSGFANTIGQIMASAQVGGQIGSIFGFKGTQNNQFQQNLNNAASAIGYAIGGPVGATIASIGAQVVGSFINSGTRPNAMSQIGYRNGRFGVTRTTSVDGGPQGEIAALGQQVATGLNALTTAFGLTGGFLANFSTNIGYVTGDRSFYGLGGRGFYGGQINPGQQDFGNPQANALRRGTDFSREQDAQAAVNRVIRDFITQAIQSGALNLSTAEKALIDSAEDLSAAAQQIMEIRATPGALALQLLGYTNPRGAALIQLRQQQVARRQQMQDLYDQGFLAQGSQDQVLSALEAQEIRATLLQFSDAVNGATASLEQLREAQDRIGEFARGLLTSNLSPLSPEARLNQTGSVFAAGLASARGGNYGALQTITDQAAAYLENAQQFFGSTEQYANIFTQVQQALAELADMTFADPLQSAIAEQTAALQAAIANGSVDIVEAIEELGGLVAGMGEAIANSNIEGAGQIAGAVGAANETASSLGGGFTNPITSVAQPRPLTRRERRFLRNHPGWAPPAA